MKILTPTDFSSYMLLDSGESQRLEKFGDYTLVRPDPQAIWQKHLPESAWQNVDAKFIKQGSDKGRWKIFSKMPSKWLMEYHGLKFYAKLSPFKHTGIFPEQAVQWKFINESIHKVISHSINNQIQILNLFGYTGISSLAAVQAGAAVTHVDASYPAIGWFKENIQASNLGAKPIRYIEDDVVKFVEREVRRENKYAGIIMDPPVYGHGPHGEVWDFNKSFPYLIKLCRKLLSKNPLFIIVNAYAISISAITLNNVLVDSLSELGGEIEYGELALEENSRSRLLSTGIFARWNK